MFIGLLFAFFLHANLWADIFNVIRELCATVLTVFSKVCLHGLK